jgi:transketolase
MSVFETFSGKISLRDAIGNHMKELGRINEKVIVVNADLMGTCRTRSFSEAYPQRTFNVGIAEQDMISFSAGFAHEGFIPYAFSMAPFISMRACEQCRTDVAYGHLPVRMVATYAGYSGGISGATHWGVEDCAIMGSMAGMTVLEPSDPYQACKMLEATLDKEGPVYIRSSVEPVPVIYDQKYSYQIGKSSVVRNGCDGTFIVSGITVHFAIEAADRIQALSGKKIQVIDMSTIKPIDRDAVMSAVKTKNIITAQDHNVVGGLGYYTAAVIAETGCAVKFKILGCPDQFIPMAHAPFLYHKYEFDTDGLVKNMLQMLQL